MKSSRANCRVAACIPLPLHDDVLNDVVQKAKDWALMHGIGVRGHINFNVDSLYHAPFLLLPSCFPKNQFQRAVVLQPLINEMMYKVAGDHEFLEQALKQTILVDDFTRNLYDIYETVRKEGIEQPVSFGILRTDYFLNHSTESIKQIEINTIAASFGALSTNVQHMHRYILTELGHKAKCDDVAENNSKARIARGMLDAWKIYKKPQSVILFVVEDITYNICDQRGLEYEIRNQNPDVAVIRKSLLEVMEQGYLNIEKELIINQHEVSVVYFRTGYVPEDQPTAKHWEARLLIERSKAIKCPSIQFHLAGSKKVQQELSRPGALERFFQDKLKVDQIRSVFAGLYSLDFDSSGEKAIESALADPCAFVLKPQREGGGNNVYDENVREALLKMRECQERTAWILMERIFPPLQKNYFISLNNEYSCADVIGELGIYGVVIGKGNVILKNEYSGYVMRSKLSTTNEGGVVAGSGALDSVYLSTSKCDNCDR